MNVVRNGTVNEIVHETQGRAPPSSKLAFCWQDNIGDDDDDGLKISLSPFGNNIGNAALDHDRVQSIHHKNTRTYQC